MNLAVRLALAFICALILFSLVATAALAATCAPREAILAQLATRWEEHQQGLGLDASGNLIELYASEAGSWTLIATTAGGPTCLLASGSGWSVGAVPPPEGEPL